ncbi:hypothetical protein KHQ81_15415 (plasmid) [Mycoplasmatota bacterium]|nr:hypothetical protein KHQ81_15415 [Mycoplasmatota bacterium]
MSKFDVTKRYEYITALEKKRGELLVEIKESNNKVDILTDEFEQTQQTITLLKTKTDDDIMKDLELIRNINKILP